MKYFAMIDEEASASDLAHQWRNGNCESVIAALANDHPALAALVIVQGAQDGILSLQDCNAIANQLIDDRVSIVHG